MRIDRLEPAHAEAVTRLWLNSFEEHHHMDPDYYRDPDAALALTLRQKLTDLLEDSNMAVFVALDDGNDVHGFVFVRKSAPQYLDTKLENVAEVEELFVRADARRKGLAARLIEAAESYAVQSGAQAIKLLVSAENLGAMGFYEARGYAVRQCLMLRSLSLTSKT